MRTPCARPQVPATAAPLSAPVVTAGVGEVIAQLDPPPSGSVSLPWKLDGRSADGSRLYVTYVAGDDDCVRFAGFTLSGSAQALQLQAVGAVDASKTACASRLEQGRGVLVLPEALGDRQLVHGPVSPDWANGLAGLPEQHAGIGARVRRDDRRRRRPAGRRAPGALRGRRFAASGLRLLRVGQRLTLELAPAGQPLTVLALRLNGVERGQPRSYRAPTASSLSRNCS